MNELQIFSNEQFGDIRVSEIDGKPWFVAADVCKALEHSNVSVAIDRLDDDEKAKLNLGLAGGEINVISEAGLYVLVLGSRKPEAKAFKRWITHDVLPTIRKHGMWAREDILANPDVLIAVATELKREQEARKALETERQTLLPKAEYYDALVDRNLMTNFRETAKLLDVPERLMIAKLVDAGFLFRNSRGGILPYAQRNRGYFAIKEYYNTQNGYMGVQTLVTFKGREKLLRMFNKAVA